MHIPLVSNTPPLGSRNKKIPQTGRGVSLGTAGIDWWVLFNILKEDEVLNQQKDKIKRSALGSRKQKSASKTQREKRQDRKKRREAEQRKAIQ